jgi:hypothetical protein
MNNYWLEERVARQRQDELRREAMQERRAKLALKDEPGPSVLRRLFSLFGGVLEAQPTRSASVGQDQEAPAVNSHRLDDCLAC